MPRVRIVRKDDSQEVAERVVSRILQHYKTIRLHQGEDPWYLEIPASYQWTQEDADFLNDLAHKQDLLAGWHYQEWT